MSQENVENLRAFLDDWSRQPWTPEAWDRGEVIDMSFFDPEVVYEEGREWVRSRSGNSRALRS